MAHRGLVSVEYMPISSLRLCTNQPTPIRKHSKNRTAKIEFIVFALLVSTIVKAIELCIGITLFLPPNFGSYQVSNAH